MNKRLLALTRDARLALVLTIIAGFLGGLLIVMQASTLSGVIERVYLGRATLTQVVPSLALLLLIFLGRAILAGGSEISADALAVRVKHDLRGRLFAHLAKLGPGYVRGERTGELTAAAMEGVDALDAYFGQYLPQLIISAIVPLLILFFVFPLDPISGLIMLFTAPLIPLFMVLIGRGAEALTRRQFETLGQLSAYFLDSLQGLTTLKQFGRNKAHARNLAQANERFRDITLQVLRVTFLSALTLELLATLSVALIAVEIGLRLLYGRMDFHEALFLLVVAPEFYMPLRMLAQRFHAGMSGTVAAQRIFQMLDATAPSAVTTESEKVETPLSSPRPFSNLSISHVTYTYPGEAAPALRDLTATFKWGQRISLVGPSGSGKSTFANLLLRFAEPSSGQILLDGKPLSDLPADAWRAQIAWVPQAPHLFHDTIAANIRIARPEASSSEVAEAAQAAHLDEFIESLPEKYETVIGEGGTRLSGGQAQRLALARAFLKAAPVLILDEPTSNLDLVQERLLEDSLRRLALDGQTRTVITITHRLNTAVKADQIMVFEHGALVETGSHAELLARGDVYSRMLAALRQGSSVKQEAKLRLPNPGRNLSAMLSGELEIEDVKQAELGDGPVSDTSSLVRLLGFLKGSGWRVLLSVGLGALTIFASIGLMGTSAYLISAAALHPSIGVLGTTIVGVRFFGLSRAVFRYLERLASHDVTLRVLTRLRSWFYEALEPLAPARLMQYRSGDLLSRIVADVNNLENFYVRAVAPPLVAAVVVAVTSLFLADFARPLGWVAAAGLALLGIGVPVLSHALSRRPAGELISGRAELAHLVVDGIQGLADLTAFGRTADRVQQIAAGDHRAAKAQHRLARISGINTGLTSLLTNLGAWTVLVIGIQLVTRGELAGVMLASVVLITLASFEAVTPLPQAAQMLSSCLESAGRLFEIVNTIPAVSEPQGHWAPQGVMRFDPPPSAPPIIEVKALGFRYAPGASPALRDIGFSLHPGQALAVVGPSGAGKSTLLNLLLRFWDFQDGEILVAGQSVQGLPTDAVRRHFTVVSQNSYFFNATVRENLLLGNPGASSEELEAATSRAQICDVLAALPHGYETRIGERGSRLSGGERQRMAIARALLKQAPVLLLDEPTANLDPSTARGLLETLFSLMRERQRSTLMITHLLWGMEHFDEIIVLDAGRIIERGSHRSLLAEGGFYHHLWKLQSEALWI